MGSKVMGASLVETIRMKAPREAVEVAPLAPVVETPEILVGIRDLRKSYRLGKTEVHALKGASLSIRKGAFASIMGPSGSGKTTLLNLIGCLDRPDSGSIEIGGADLAPMSRNQLAAVRAQKIGFIFQSFNLIPVLDVYENVEFPLYIKNDKATGRERRQRIDRLIEEVGLMPYVRHRPDELSGGQRQRVAIARALVTDPEIVLADEPTANLDSQTARSIIELMQRLNEEKRVTFIFSTHDTNVIKYATHVYRIVDGRIDNGSARG